MTESRVDGAEIQYCDSYGTIWFDGHGYAETVMSLRRCTWHPSGTVQIDVDDPGEFDYEVYPNGEFLLIELDDVTGLPTDYITHGRIVHDKDMLIVDGTRGCTGPPPACPHPEFLQTIAVGVKE